MSAGSALFAPEREVRFGETAGNHRYRMPLLPGEQGTKGGGDWVPWNMQSSTNLASSISDTKALGRWEREQLQVGLVLRPDLYERLTILVQRAAAEGVNFREIKLRPELRDELGSIHEEAKTASGANAARQAGINRHDAWETRGATGRLIGTSDIQRDIERVEELLERKRLARVSGLQEKVVRNTEVNCAGRFDDILICQDTGRLLMADLKTKQKPFWGWMEIDAQLAIYAYAEWMLPEIGSSTYVEGPRHYVDLEVGVVLHMPSDGGEPALRKADLTAGWRTAQLARQVCDARSAGKSAARDAASYW